MTIGETAAFLKLSVSSLYKLAQVGKVPGQKVGKHWRFHRGVIERWIKEGRRHGKIEKREGNGGCRGFEPTSPRPCLGGRGLRRARVKKDRKGEVE